MSIGTSRSFQDCIKQRKNDEPYKALREGGPILRREVLRLFLHQTCVGKFTDENQAAITALATAVVALFTFRLWLSTDRLWEVSREQGLIAQRALSGAERPWITVKIELENGITYNDDFCCAGLCFKLGNVGKSPAMDIQIVFDAFPLSRGQHPDAVQEKMLKNTLNEDVIFGFGLTILPGDAIEEVRVMQISNRRIVALYDEGGKVNKFYPYIVGLVTYRFSLSDKVHYTGFIYSIQERGQSDIRIWENIENGDLALSTPSAYYLNQAI